MNFSNQQEQALAEIKKWLGQKDKQVFRLFGFAGTGKTTLAKAIAELTKMPVFAAFTGKAASVMRRKGCIGAETIHSLIYKVIDRYGVIDFKINRDSDAKYASLIIIDECSMIDEKIGTDLLSFGTKILVLGDPAQLPPIEGAGFFTSQQPDFMLTEVHRQAAENPIIQLSMKIRSGERLTVGTYGETNVIDRAAVNAEIVLGADQLIVGLNKTRQRFNARIRELLKMPANVPVLEDRLICLKNDRKVGVFNGSIWSVSELTGTGKIPGTLSMVVSPLDEPDEPPVGVEIFENFFNGTEHKIDWKAKKGTQEFTFGYAITCHKAQGSQWDNVVAFDESSTFRENSTRWLYTCVTRAAEKLTLVVSN